MFLSRFYRQVCMAIASTLLFAIPAQAALLNNQLNYPLITYSNPQSASTTYNAATNAFTMISIPVAIRENGSSFPVIIGGEAGISLYIEVDENGALVPNAAASDAFISGFVTLNSGSYGSTLLQGKITAFGFKDSGGTTDYYDFKMTVTGGTLAFLYPAEVGIALTSEQSTFVGDFNLNISGSARGIVGAIIPAGATASLGDFVWEDLNADGIQDSNEPGIGNVIVNLLSPGTDAICNTGDEFVIATTMTGSNGEYGFTDLDPGEYCLEFIAPASYVISPQDMGADDIKDSDADPVTGQTVNIILDAGENDLSWDAGLYQPAVLGDYVWNDLNKDGLQDANETGVANITVNLLDCSGANILDTLGQPISAITGANGEYLFDNLVLGSYIIEFVIPTAYVFSPPGVGFDGAFDSDANVVTGRSSCMTLESGEYNGDVDAGIYQQVSASCDVTVTKSCAIVPVNSADFVCSAAKPLDQLSMIWNGSSNVDVVAHYGSLSAAVVGTRYNVAPGDEVTFSGFAGAGNNVEWEMFVAGTTTSLGKSGFHMSCSDSDMNGPQHCGTAQGDNKTNDGGLNSWLLEGMAGSNGIALDCTVTPAPSTVSACAFTTPAGPHCKGKVLAIDLHYLGGDCLITPNNQEGKARCLVGGTASEPVRIRVTDGGSKTYLDQAGIMLGTIVTASAANAGVSEFGSSTVIEIYDLSDTLVQKTELHTSCSKPLNLGDRFGSVEVVTLNTTEQGSQSLGAEVNYSYVITNNSTETFEGAATDNVLGSIADPLVLAPTQVFATTLNQFVLPDATGVFANTVTVNGALTPSGVACQVDASATVTRTVLLPQCKVEGENKLKISNDKIEWKLFNTGNDPITVSDIHISFPGTRGIKTIKLDGEIFSNGNVLSPAVVDTFVNELKNRQIKPNDAKKLVIEFTGKTKETKPSDYLITVNFVGGCSVTLDIKTQVGMYKCTKPIDVLTMIWTGADSVEVEAFKGDTGTQSLGKQLVAPAGEVTFSGFAGSPNDVYWVIKDAVSGESIGQSKFHLSCSDDQMNGVEDCGALEGNGKDNNTTLINLWKLEGIVDGGGMLNCTP